MTTAIVLAPTLRQADMVIRALGIRGAKKFSTSNPERLLGNVEGTALLVYMFGTLAPEVQEQVKAMSFSSPVYLIETMVKGLPRQ